MKTRRCKNFNFRGKRKFSVNCWQNLIDIYFGWQAQQWILFYPGFSTLLKFF